MQVKIFKVPMASPDDISGLARLLDEGEIKAEEIVAILGKTEGNGCVNDFTRGYATSAFSGFLAERMNVSRSEVSGRIAFVMSGGTEGVISPHASIFAVCGSDAEGIPGDEKTLAVASGFTRKFLPEEQGTMAMVTEVCDVVRQLMKKAGIKASEDVHFVQVKCPLLTSERIMDAQNRGKEVVTHDTYESMGYTRGASALGIALALGELKDSEVTQDKICRDYSLYSGVASTSAGVELLNCEIILMGNSENWNSNYKIGHSVMKDAIDIQSVYKAIKDSCNGDFDLNRLVNVYAKAGAESEGMVRGCRTTMHTDSDFNHTRHARAAVGGVVAAVAGTPMIYVSGGTEHQGPDGGGPVAAISRIK